MCYLCTQPTAGQCSLLTEDGFMAAICSKPIIQASFKRAIEFYFSQCSRRNKTICADVV